MRILITLVFLIVVFTVPANTHSWYSTACCSEKDCRPILNGEVVFNIDGWYVTSHNELVKFGDVRIKKSRDNQMHVCEGEANVRCLYVPEPET